MLFRIKFHVFISFAASNQSSLGISTALGELNFAGAFGGLVSPQSKRSHTFTSKSKRLLPVSVNAQTPDDEEFDESLDESNELETLKKIPRRDSGESNEGLREIFTENLFGQRDNQMLQKEVLELHKAKLQEKMDIDIQASKIELQKKEIELQLARELAEIEVKKQRELADLEIKKKKKDLE